METFIRFYDNAIAESVCDNIITLFENDDSKYVGVGASGNISPNKITTDLEIIPTKDGWSLYHSILQSTIGQYLKLYMQEFASHFNAIKSLNDSGYKLMKYEKNKGVFGPHADVNGLKTMHRLLAVVIYLNDVTEGGETFFISQDVSIKPVKGRIAFFPTNFTHLHQSKIAKSDKYVISSFITYSA